MSETPSNTPEYSVSEISSAVKRTVEDAFGYVRVRGELGRVSRPASGHIYTDLKDDRAVLSSVMWKGTAQKLTFKPEEGLEVIATGRMTTFPGQSRYQLVIDRIEPAGVGALMKLLDERRKKLAAEGLFAEERKQLLPFLPKVIGVVTSPSGAVIRDILHRLSDRTPAHVLVWPVRVQGETSAKEVANAIKGFNALAPGGAIPQPDVLIVARGGGSLEDLWSFNEEIVARAAAESLIPLVSAVGHETDWTLIDYAADVRAPTPTGAAEMVVPVKADLVLTVDDLARRLTASTLRGVETRRRDLRSLARALPQPDALLTTPRQRLDQASLRLAQALTRGTMAQRGKLDRVAGRLSRRLITQGLSERRQAVHVQSDKLARALDQRRQRQKDRLANLGSRVSPRAVQRLVGEGRRSLGQLDARMLRAIGQHFDTRKNQIAQRAKLLDAFNYRRVLDRGFAVIRDASGTPLRQVAQLDAAGAVQIELADGTRDAVVGAATDGSPPKASKSKEAKPKRVVDARPAPKQENLFD
jgi:exodeoxyribonuclease VII large subunit